MTKVKYAKREIGEFQNYKVPCDNITVTKFIKTNFSDNFHWKIFYLLYNFATKSYKMIAKRISFQSAVNYLCIGIFFSH